MAEEKRFVRCLREDIAAYLDGELSFADSSEFELHLSNCDKCRAEMTNQRRFLSELSLLLADEAIPPADDELTRRLVVNAESSLVGLRHWNERFTAMFLFLTLAIFILFTFGREADAFVGIAAAIVDKGMAVAIFIFKLLFSIGSAISVVIRTFTSNAGIAGAGVTLVLAAVAAYLSRPLFLRMKGV